MSRAPIDVVAAVIRDGGRILACRRSPGRAEGGKWEFPGGKIEPGERPDQALVREVREELGVGIRIVGPLAGDPASEGVVTQTAAGGIRLRCFVAELTGERPGASSDHDALAWLRPRELSALDWAAADLAAVREVSGWDAPGTLAPVTTLVLTVVGDDRAGLVAAVADVVAAHGGNWQTSRLAELSGSFAGMIEVSVPAGSEQALRRALEGLDGLLTVTVHSRGSEGGAEPEARQIELHVLGNDRPGIVRDVTSVLGTHGVSIEHLATDTRDAAMYGGRLFEASVSANVPASVDLAALRADLERIATEIQVDLTIA